jgi:hypothetical protein
MIEPVSKIQGEQLPIPKVGNYPTLIGLMEKAQSYMGSNFFTYDPYLNNCASFVVSVLKANGLWNEKDTQFLYQDVSTLAKKLPESHMIGKFVTKLGAVVSRIRGKGELEGGAYMPQKSSDLQRELDDILNIIKRDLYPDQTTDTINHHLIRAALTHFGSQNFNTRQFIDYIMNLYRKAIEEGSDDSMFDTPSSSSSQSPPPPSPPPRRGQLRPRNLMDDPVFTGGAYIDNGNKDQNLELDDLLNHYKHIFNISENASFIKNLVIENLLSSRNTDFDTTELIRILKRTIEMKRAQIEENERRNSDFVDDLRNRRPIVYDDEESDEESPPSVFGSEYDPEFDESAHSEYSGRGHPANPKKKRELKRTVGSFVDYSLPENKEKLDVYNKSPLADFSVSELRAIAKKYKKHTGLGAVSKMTKINLIHLLHQHLDISDDGKITPKVNKTLIAKIG